MSVAPLSAAQLHEPILPLARPPLVVLQPDHTIAQTLDRIRASANARSIHYFYVVDDHEQLVGVVPARRLVAAAPEQTVRDIMDDNVVAIPDWATVLIASEYFATRRLLAFPVVNGAGQLLGVVDVSLFTDEVIDLAKRTYDDIFQLIGVHGTAQRSPWIAFRDRFPWLLCNIAGGLLAAFIASRFEHLLQRGGRAVAVHSDRARPRRERQHAGADADAAGADRRSDRLVAAVGRAVEGIPDRDAARRWLRGGRRPGGVRVARADGGCRMRSSWRFRCR